MTKYLPVFICLLAALGLTAQLKPEFSANRTEGCGSVEVVFTNLTQGADNQTRFSWDLGGVVSDRENPGRIFETPGKYTVCLTVTTAGGEQSKLCKENYIVVYALPKVDFSISQTKGCAPFQTTFKSLSTSENDIASLTWDVGGSANVVLTQNRDSVISSTYTKGGKYTVSLTIIDDKKCVNTLLRRDVLEVLAPEEVIPSKTFLKTCGLPWEVEVVNNNLASDTEYQWDFGNGFSYKGPRPPIITYDEAGSYDLKVEAIKGQCRQVFEFPSFVNTEESAVINISKTLPCTDEAVTFEDLTSLGADSLLWTVDGLVISRNKSFEFVFEQGGCHSVVLKRFRKECIDSTRLSCFEVKPKPEIQYEITNQYTCEIPAELSLTSQGDFDVKWVFHAKNGPDTLTGNDVKYEVFQTGDYKVDLMYKDTQSCQYTLRDIPVKVEKFEVKLPVNGPGGCVGTNIILLDSIYSVLPITYQKWEVLPTLPRSSSIRNQRYMRTLWADSMFG